MDANENLKEQLNLANAILDGNGDSSDVERLANLVISLHHWLNMGGFLPDMWTQEGN